MVAHAAYAGEAAPAVIRSAKSSDEVVEARSRPCILRRTRRAPPRLARTRRLRGRGKHQSGGSGKGYNAADKADSPLLRSNFAQGTALVARRSGDLTDVSPFSDGSAVLQLRTWASQGDVFPERSVMRNRHFPRLCRACEAPMARQDDMCRRCGVHWATPGRAPTGVAREGSCSRSPRDTGDRVIRDRPPQATPTPVGPSGGSRRTPPGRVSHAEQIGTVSERDDNRSRGKGHRAVSERNDYRVEAKAALSGRSVAGTPRGQPCELGAGALQPSRERRCRRRSRNRRRVASRVREHMSVAETRVDARTTLARMGPAVKHPERRRNRRHGRRACQVRLDDRFEDDHLRRRCLSCPGSDCWVVAHEPVQGAEQVRAAEVIGALCLATDLGMGFPFEHGLE